MESKKDIRYAVTVAIVIDARRAKKDGTFPVKLRVTYKRKQQYYAIKDKSYTTEDFEKITSNKKSIRRSKQILEEETALNGIKQFAEDIIEEIKDEFSFVEFEKRFFSAKTKQQNLNDLFAEKMNQLKSSKRLSTASLYKATQKALTDYKPKSLSSINSITPDFLKGFEQHNIENGNSYTTVGVYCRNIRAIINSAIKKELLEPKSNPFGRKEDGKYEIPESNNIKKALDLADIKKIFKYEAPTNSPIAQAKDYWLFSYLANGMNMCDIAYLKKDNFDTEEFSFYRKKTINTSKKKKLISVSVTPHLQDIIDRRSSSDSKSMYVFPILEEGLSIEDQNRRIKQFIKNTNKYMKRISKEIGLKFEVTTYHARHSFSTILKRSGASIEFIGEQLGHTSPRVTENYLDSFKSDQRRDFANKLTDF